MNSVPYHIISYHIISYHTYIISYHIISYRIISYHIISYIYHIISYHTYIISYHIIYHFIYHIISCLIIWLIHFTCCDWSISGPYVAVRTSSSVNTSNEFVPFPEYSTKPYKKHLISLACSVRKLVMDPRFFFLPCFHGPRASCLGLKRNGKISVHNLLDLALG